MFNSNIKKIKNKSIVFNNKLLRHNDKVKFQGPIYNNNLNFPVLITRGTKTYIYFNQIETEVKFIKKYHILDVKT